MEGLSTPKLLRQFKKHKASDSSLDAVSLSVLKNLPGLEHALQEPKIVSQGKKAQQSTEANDGGPARAVDGSTNGDYSSGSCTHTKQQGNPWWRVDLQGTVEVTRVVVWNRVDCCRSRLDNFQVQVDSTLCGTVKSAETRNTVTCKGAVGSSVTVTLMTHGLLTLCEVQVYGRKDEHQTAVRKVMSVNLAQDDTEVALQAATLRKRNLRELSFNNRAKNALLLYLASFKLLSGKELKNSRHMTAEAVAERTLKILDRQKYRWRMSTVRALAAGISHGSEGAARKLVALREIEAQKRTLVEKSKYSSKSLEDDTFASAVKFVIFHVLTERGVLGKMSQEAKEGMSVQETAQMLHSRGLNADKMSNSVEYEAVKSAGAIQGGSRGAAAQLLATYNVALQNDVQRELCKYTKSSFLDGKFSSKVKEVLTSTLLQAGVVNRADQLNREKCGECGVPQLAKMAVDSSQVKKLHYPLPMAIERLAKSLVQEDSHAGAELLATWEVVSEGPVEAAEKKLKGKSLRDKKFNEFVKFALIKPLFLVGVLSDPRVPKIHTMSAQAAARLLQLYGHLHPQKLAHDPLGSAALRFAGRIAAGNDAAAISLAARRTVQVRGAEKREVAKLSKVKSLSDKAFHEKLQRTLLRACMLVGVKIPSGTPSVHTLANRLKGRQSTSSDPLVAEAIRLAPDISTGSLVAAKKLMALRMVYKHEALEEMTVSVDLEKIQYKDTWVQLELKKILVQSLRHFRIIKNVDKFRIEIESKSAQHVAKVLSDAGSGKMKENTLYDESSASAAMRLASRIQKSDLEAARDLIARDMQNFQDFVQEKMADMRNVKLDEKDFRDRVRSALKKALVMTGAYKGDELALQTSTLRMLAKDLTLVPVVSRHLGSPVGRAALRLAPLLAQEDILAARELVATHDVERDQEISSLLKSWTDGKPQSATNAQLKTATEVAAIEDGVEMFMPRYLKSSFKSERFTHSVTEVMLSVLKDYGLINPSAYAGEMNVTDVAQQASKMDAPPQAKDPLGSVVVSLAALVVKGNARAGAQVLATAAVVLDRKIESIKAKYAKQSLKQAGSEFSQRTRDGLIKALKSSGALSLLNDDSLLQLDAKQAAQVCMVRNDPVEKREMLTPEFAAFRLAPR
jgi:hypothetical protein